MRKILILSLLASLMCSVYLIRFYTKTGIKNIEEKITNTNLLLKEGKETIAQYADNYSEYKRRGTVKAKFIKYYFTVNNKKYENEIMINTIPTESFFKLFYLPQNPDIHSQNPINDLAALNTQMEMERKEDPLVVWIVLIAAVSLIVFYFKKRKTELNNDKELAFLKSQYK